MPEPRLEELSAYVDHELTGAARQEIEAHLRDCEVCRRRVSALRRTVSAIQELPVEAPPRPFTIPAQREQRRRTGALLGWLGGAAAAALVAVVVIAGFQNLHLPSGAAGSGALSVAGPAQRSQNGGQASGNASQPVPGTAYDFTQASRYPHQAAIVIDPRNPGRRLRLASDAAAYPGDGTVRLEVILEGSPIDSLDAARDGIQLSLQRNGAGSLLPAPAGLAASSGPPTFTGSYQVSGLSLPEGPGSYLLVATWTVPDGSGTILTAQLPIEIRG